MNLFLLTRRWFWLLMYRRKSRGGYAASIETHGATTPAHSTIVCPVTGGRVAIAVSGTGECMEKTAGIQARFGDFEADVGAAPISIDNPEGIESIDNFTADIARRIFTQKRGF